MNRKNGKFVYKDAESMEKMHAFYDRALGSLGIDFTERYIDTSYGKTHVVFAGDESKPPIFTLHGGNGICPLNLRIFLPLLKDFRIIAPDVIGMPGKSAPYRDLSTRREDFGKWEKELLDALGIEKIPFAVSSYSSAMLLSLAKLAPERIEKAALLVPSGITHGALLPIAVKMSVPLMKYYFVQSEKALGGIMELMASQSDEQWKGFFHLMMSSYKMEMRPPKEYTRSELKDFRAPVMIFASNDDIFFPADRVFPKAKRIFTQPVRSYLIKGHHLPSEATMRAVCGKISEFFSE